MKKKMGRPKIEVDLEMVESLARVGCTDEEIAREIGICLGSLKNRKKEQDFLTALKKGRTGANISIRRAQFIAGVENGNVTMLIWLGKQMLGQRDKHEFEISDELLLERLRQIRAEAEAKASADEKDR